MFYRLDIEKMLAREDVQSIHRFYIEIENDFGDVIDEYWSLCVEFTDKRLIVYDDEQEVYKIGRGHWWGTSWTVIGMPCQDNFFTNEELDEVHK